MARNDRSDRRRTARPVYRTNGAAAYDVRYSTRELEYGSAARRLPERKTEPRPQTPAEAQSKAVRVAPGGGGTCGCGIHAGVRPVRLRAAL